jgi:3-phenylpropionate/cinnamic acid dioxygenase small subunit
MSASRFEDLMRAQEFLFHEAELLDDWRLLAWIEVITEDIDYRIPVRSTRGEDSADKTFSTSSFHMVENHASLVTRMRRFGEGAWSEAPQSRVRRHISNVRVARQDAGALAVRSNLLFFWARDKQVLVSGERHDILRETDGGLRLAKRLVLLDHTSLPLPNLTVVL